MVPRLSALLSALAIALGGAACGSQKRSEDDDVAPDVLFEQVEFQVFRGDELTASGTASSARLRRDTNALDVEAIEIKFPSTAQREEATATAARGHGNLAERWFVAEGGVTAVQGDDAARTERARYSRAEGIVRGDSPITVSGPGYQLTGPGFALDPRTRTVRVDGGAKIRAEGASR
jgi:LPS export ABC transporter protein LptC